MAHPNTLMCLYILLRRRYNEYGGHSDSMPNFGADGFDHKAVNSWSRRQTLAISAWSQAFVRPL